MEAGKDTRYTRLFECIERKKQKLGETAARFPKTKEEYMEKPVDERMKIAMDILRAYAEIGRYSPGRVAANIIPKDKLDMVITGKVGYIPEEKIAFSRHSTRRDYESIQVVVGAKEVATGIETDRNEREELGKIRKGTYLDGSGERQNGWVVMLAEKEFPTLPLSSQLGEELVEFIDAAVVGLLEGKVREYRKFLGDTAIASAAETRFELPLS